MDYQILDEFEKLKLFSLESRDYNVPNLVYLLLTIIVRKMKNLFKETSMKLFLSKRKLTTFLILVKVN
jgi:hypothetical protein